MTGKSMPTVSVSQDPQALYRMLVDLRDLPDLRALAASSVTARAAHTGRHR